MTDDIYQARLIPLGGTDIYAAYDNPFTSDKVRGHLLRSEGGGVAKGRVVFCPGFTEFCEKYAHIGAHLTKAGYDVLMIDWPGQGRSGHFGTHSEYVNLDDFETHLRALEALLDEAGWTENLVIFGHSMGGHLSLRAADRFADRIKAVMLSAPMIRPMAGPAAGVRLLGKMLDRLGQGGRRAPFQIHLSAATARQAGSLNPLTHDAAFFDLSYQLYDKEPALRRAVPTVNWVRAAYRSCVKTSLNPQWMAGIKQPVLALLAEQEYICHNPSAKRALSWLNTAEIHVIDGARHEILNELPEIQARIWPHYLRFLERQFSS